jgi:hypothetical protein
MTASTINVTRSALSKQVRPGFADMVNPHWDYAGIGREAAQPRQGWRTSKGAKPIEADHAAKLHWSANRLQSSNRSPHLHHPSPQAASPQGGIIASGGIASRRVEFRPKREVDLPWHNSRGASVGMSSAGRLMHRSSLARTLTIQATIIHVQAYRNSPTYPS